MFRMETQATVTVWTIQPWAVWEQVSVQGTLTVDPRYGANLHYAYDWLRKTLRHRIAGYGGHYPWWAYATRPDHRERRNHKPRGERHVLLELDIPRAQV